MPNPDPQPDPPPAAPLLDVGSANRIDGSLSVGDMAGRDLDKSTHTHLYFPQRTEPPAPAFQVPYLPNPLFVGREQELDELARLLTGDAPVALTPAIAGMGGVGKTQLAAEFAHRQRAAFPGGVFWLNMEQPDAIVTQVAACAGPGGLDLPAYDAMGLDERLQRVKSAWAQPAPRRLLVFDNLEDPALLRQWRPYAGASRLLITTRRDDWLAQISRLRLRTLQRAESLCLLLRPRAEEQGRALDALLADATQCAEAEAICELLGDLPLALALAGAYLRLYPGISLAAYRARLVDDPLADERRADTAMQEVLAEAGLPTGRERGIVATFAISYEPLDAADPDDAVALRMLHAAACCAPAPIPQELLWWAGELPDDDSADDDSAGIEHIEQRDRAIRRLRALGLLTREAEGAPPPLLLHRLPAAYIRSRIDVAAAQRALYPALTHAAHAAVNSGYPARSAPLLPHLLHNAATPPLGEDMLHATFLNALALVQHQQINYAAARPLLERALAIEEAIYGPDHPEVATGINNLAGLLEAQGEYAVARPLYERALAIREAGLGPQHPATATSLNNLASLHYAQGEYAAARPLYERVLAIREAVLGPQHPDTAQSLNNMALLLEAMGEYAAVRVLYERALGIREAVLGPHHPATATSLNNLAGLLVNQGEYEAARPLYEQALVIAEQALGPQHPDTARSLNNLALLDYTQGEYAAARALYERALAISEQVLGPQHPHTTTSLNNLSEVLRAQGEYGVARPLFERALAVREAALGPQHPDTATSLNNLALLCCDEGDFSSAARLMQRALGIREAVLGPQHPHTQSSRESLAAIEAKMQSDDPTTGW